MVVFHAYFFCSFQNFRLETMLKLKNLHAEICKDHVKKPHGSTFSKYNPPISRCNKFHPPGIPATTVPIPTDFPQIQPDFCYPHPSADLECECRR